MEEEEDCSPQWHEELARKVQTIAITPPLLRATLHASRLDICAAILATGFEPRLVWIVGCRLVLGVDRLGGREVYINEPRGLSVGDLLLRAAYAAWAHGCDFRILAVRLFGIGEDIFIAPESPFGGFAPVFADSPAVAESLAASDDAEE